MLINIDLLDKVSEQAMASPNSYYESGRVYPGRFAHRCCLPTAEMVENTHNWLWYLHRY